MSDLRENPIPRWYSVPATLIPLLVAALTGVVAAFSQGGDRLYGSTLCLCATFMTVAAVRALLVPRRSRPVAPDAGGELVLSSPLSIVVPLIGAWVTGVAAALLTGWFLLTDPSMIETPVMAGVFVVGAVASLPDLLRLVTGRLRRWQVVLTPESFIYRGYRTDTTVAWSDVRGARISHRPAGVLVGVRGARTDQLVPYAVLDVPAQQLVDLVIQHRRQRAGR